MWGSGGTQGPFNTAAACLFFFFFYTIMLIVKELGDMVHRKAYAEIEEQNTSYKKMIEFWDGPLHSGGTPVKAAFYDTLKKHEPELLMNLCSS
uniref:Uncharacterized protein n=1 Tax=Oryzias latipes TaxID=8090 RepID=A0A3P9JYR0_ORYLA